MTPVLDVARCGSSAPPAAGLTRRRLLGTVGALGAAAVLGGCATTEPTPAPGPATRTVDSALGPVAVPVDAQRIVTDIVGFDNLLAMGFDLGRVVGVLYSGDPELVTRSPFIAATARDAAVADPSTPDGPDFEKLLALAPDLVVMPHDQFDETLADRFRRAAPTVAYRTGGGKSFEDWKPSLRAMAGVLGGDAPAAADRYVAAFEDRVRQVRARHRDLVDRTTVTIGGVAGDAVRISLPGRNIGTNVAGELGLRRPDAQLALAGDEFGVFDVSLERLDLLDADLIVLERRQDDTAVVTRNSLWGQLRAVRAGDVRFVGNYWEYGGAGSAGHVLDDLDAALADLRA